MLTRYFDQRLTTIMVFLLQISLYHENRVALQAERGVTLGLLKLIYSSDASNCGILLGVKPRKGDTNNVQRLITSDTSTLDEDEYDLIVKGKSE